MRPLTKISKKDALNMLKDSNTISEREIRRNQIKLARKYYPVKWKEDHDFESAEGENVFKNTSKTCELLKK